MTVPLYVVCVPCHLSMFHHFVGQSSIFNAKEKSKSWMCHCMSWALSLGATTQTEIEEQNLRDPESNSIFASLRGSSFLCWVRAIFQWNLIMWARAAFLLVKEKSKSWTTTQTEIEEQNLRDPESNSIIASLRGEVFLLGSDNLSMDPHYVGQSSIFTC